MITLAVLFLVVLFLIKNTSIFKNTVSFIQGEQQGLVYGTAKVGDLINKDTDEDGVLDWEEALLGLDPSKKETVPGVPDSTTANKLRVEKTGSTNEATGEKNLTETDKFSRELLSTVTSLSQNGAMDQATVEQISTSLIEKIQSPVQRKVLIPSEIKTLPVNNDKTKAIQNYLSTLANIQTKDPIDEDFTNIVTIFQRVIVDENTVDTSVLTELDPIITKGKNMIDEISKMTVPQFLAEPHLAVLNSAQKIIENLNDIKLFDTDPILAMGAINVCEENITSFITAVMNLSDTIDKELSN